MPDFVIGVPDYLKYLDPLMLCMRASNDLASMRIDAISTEISGTCPFISKSSISQYILDFGISHLILHQLRLIEL